MRFSIGLATFTLLFATAVVEATFHDAAAHKRHAAQVVGRDVAHRAGKRCKPRPPGHTSSTHHNHTVHTTPAHIHPASSSTPNVPKPSPVTHKVEAPAHKGSNLIEVSPGQCNPIGATSTLRLVGAFVGRNEDLTVVVISESHKTKWP